VLATKLNSGAQLANKNNEVNSSQCRALWCFRMHRKGGGKTCL